MGNNIESPKYLTPQKGTVSNMLTKLFKNEEKISNLNTAQKENSLYNQDRLFENFESKFHS